MNTILCLFSCLECQTVNQNYVKAAKLLSYLHCIYFERENKSDIEKNYWFICNPLLVNFHAYKMVVLAAVIHLVRVFPSLFFMIDVQNVYCIILRVSHGQPNKQSSFTHFGMVSELDVNVIMSTWYLREASVLVRISLLV